MNCYILIGGRSLRMGASKTALFLERVLAAARPAFDDVVAVQRAGGDAAPGMGTIFEEEHPGEAAIFGVARALQDAGGPAFLLAVDYPLITTDVLRFLREDGRVPVWNGRPQPLCAVWSAAAPGRVEQRIAANRLDLLGACEQEMIEESVLRARFPGEPLMNVNTPEEWKEAEKSYGR